MHSGGTIMAEITNRIVVMNEGTEMETTDASCCMTLISMIGTW